MPLVVDPGLLRYMTSNSGACTFLLKETEPERAVRGLQAACRAVGAIPNPEEPGDPLPSYLSAPEPTDDGAQCTMDIADAEVYEGLLDRVLQAVLDGLAAEGVVSGLLTYPTIVESHDVRMRKRPRPRCLPTRASRSPMGSAGRRSESRCPIPTNSCGRADPRPGTDCPTTKSS